MNPATEVRPNAWLRRPRRIWSFVVFLVAIAVGLVAMLVPLAGRSSANEGAMAYVWVLLFSALFTSPYLFFAYRISRSGMWMGPDAIVIRGPLRTRTVAARSAVSFAPGVQASYRNGTPCPVLTQADGTKTGVWALGREGLIWNFDEYLEEMRPLCDRLNVELETLYPDHVQTLVQPSPAESTRLR